MDELGWRIMPLCDPDLLDDAKADMHFAGVFHAEEENMYVLDQRAGELCFL